MVKKRTNMVDQINQHNIMLSRLIEIDPSEILGKIIEGYHEKRYQCNEPLTTENLLRHIKNSFVELQHNKIIPHTDHDSNWVNM